MLLLNLSATDWAQIGSAFFTALTALAAFGTILISVRSRQNESFPRLAIDSVVDLDGNQVRIEVTNFGGHAREVRLFLEFDGYGFAGALPNSTTWKRGETRRYLVSMPLPRTRTIHAVVEGRDLRKRYLFAETAGANRKRWPQRRAKTMNAKDVWNEFFPGVPFPTDSPHPFVNLVLQDP